MSKLKNYLEGSLIEALILSIVAVPVMAWIVINLAIDVFDRWVISIIIWMLFFGVFLNKIRLNRIYRYLRYKERKDGITCRKNRTVDGNKPSGDEE